jgi:uncharacterized circularly permuted ATP-grasp superfamily protein/uncharacterized alpha-E superfamily protein
MTSGRLEAPPDPPPGGACGVDRLGYASLPGSFDETFDERGAARPHWRPFLAGLEGQGLAEFIRGWEEARHLIREHGITYNVYGDPRGRERAWQLDPLPLLVKAEDAQAIERGLAQRARVLELVLADLYGPQALLEERLLPPELVFANPGFLRPCHGIRPAGGRFLSLYAANLARAPDGTFQCLGDRTQAPSGAGYALENRIVIGRMLAPVFRSLRVERLALFFQTFRESLRGLSPSGAESPRIVLLTPGPYNETYFEHALLARYLGFTLVEGSDLTVRDNRVYLKLLEGLQPVDVILRRLDDDFCDPLELRTDSFLGIPGLVHAVRSGNVAVANALGSALVEAPALMPFLPLLCRRLLGEELRLPSVPSWWCGDPGSLRQVLERLDRLVVKPAFAASRFEPVFGDRLGPERRAQLADRIRAAPHEFVAQEILPLPTAPVLAGDRLQPRPVVLRTYLAARGESFTLMPGGLTRFSAQVDEPVVSMQSGGGSKDTWMLSAGPVSSFTLLPPRPQPIGLSRAGGDLPSRAADNLFWLGRYAERAEGLTRLLRGIVSRLTERSGLSEAPELVALIRALPPGVFGAAESACAPAEGETPEGEPLLAAFLDDLPLVIFDRERPGSLAAATALVKRVAVMVRDRISMDMWRTIDRLDGFAASPAALQSVAGARRDPGRLLSDGLESLDRAVLALSAFGGLTDESMTRGAGWRFLDIGRRLERCLHTLALLDGALSVARENEGPVLEAVLEIADCSMTYRRRYLGDLEAGAVLDLILMDRDNPRSLVFQLAAMAGNARHLPERDRRIEEDLLLECLVALQLADMAEVASVDDRGGRPQLRSLLATLGSRLPSLSDRITERYLSHLQTSRHLGFGGEGVGP